MKELEYVTDEQKRRQVRVDSEDYCLCGYCGRRVSDACCRKREREVSAVNAYIAAVRCVQ